MMPTARMGDLTIGNCGLGYLIPFGATVLVNNKPIAKIGDIAKAEGVYWTLREDAIRHFKAGKIDLEEALSYTIT